MSFFCNPRKRTTAQHLYETVGVFFSFFPLSADAGSVEIFLKLRILSKDCKNYFIKSQKVFLVILQIELQIQNLKDIVHCN